MPANTCTCARAQRRVLREEPLQLSSRIGTHRASAASWARCVSLRTMRGAAAERPERRGPAGIWYRCTWLLRLVSTICARLVQAPHHKQPHACQQGRDRQQSAQRCHRYHGWPTVWPARGFGRAQEFVYSLGVASSSPCHRHSPQVQCWPLPEIPAAAALSLLCTNNDGESQREILALCSYWIAADDGHTSGST
jgi:hypothetical protein